MQTLLISLSLFFFCVSLTEAQLQLNLAGGAQSPVQLIGSTPTVPPQRYVVITQTEEREWEALGATFTLEFWLWADAPPSNTDLNWTAPPNEMQFWDVISRHPGQNYGNEWSHFNLQLTRTQKGAAIVFWSGCGCSTPLSERDDSSCGFAYLLASDWPGLPPSERFYMRPLMWHHIAVTVDGDSLTQGFTSGRASLFVDGKRIFSNNYADPSNNPPYRTGPVCKGRPIFSQTVSGTRNDQIRLGFYNNQDTNPGTENPDYAFGFYGYIDELRIWDIARTPTEIADNWYLTVDPQPHLIGYYDFNEPATNTTFPNVATFDGLPYAEILGPLGEPPAQAPNNGLVISQIVVVRSSTKGLETQENQFTFLGASEKGYVITAASSSWASALATGDAVLRDENGEEIETFPYNVTLDPISVTFFCDDQDCTNMPLPVSETWIEYGSQETPSVISYVYFKIQPNCSEDFDACGVCGGDNRTCQCVIYHDFRNTRMQYILLTWSLEKIIVEIDKTILILESIESILSTNFDFEQIEGNYTLAAQVSYMMDFYNLCLTDYCADVTEFIESLDHYLLSLLPTPPQPVTKDVVSREINTQSSRYIQTSG